LLTACAQDKEGTAVLLFLVQNLLQITPKNCKQSGAIQQPLTDNEIDMEKIWSNED
jgi:hypothetical protein